MEPVVKEAVFELDASIAQEGGILVEHDESEERDSNDPDYDSRNSHWKNEDVMLATWIPTLLGELLQ